MPDFDLAKLPDLLARLDNDIPRGAGPYCDVWAAERREAAAAIRALMAEARASGVRLADLSKSEIEIAVAAEREACAKVCDDCAAHAMSSYSGDLPSVVGGELHWAAQEIRARGDA